MSHWQDAQGRWHVEATNGKHRRLHRRCAPGATESDAKRLEAELVRALHAATPRRVASVPGNPALMDLLAHYHDEHAPTLRSDTSKYHALRIARWADGKRASDVREVVAAIKKDLGPVYQPGTINRSLGALRKALADAWEREETAADYSGLVKAMPDAHRARKVTLSLEQVKMIADCASPAVRVAIWASLFTGCRRGEILKAKAEDIGTDTLRVLAGNTKTLRYREVPIIPAARPWLAQLPLAINFEGVKTGFRRAREKAGMPHVQYRDLRRSCGTLLLQAGAPMHTVSQILGHTSVTVTEKHYAFLADRQKREAMQRAFKVVPPDAPTGPRTTRKAKHA